MTTINRSHFIAVPTTAEAFADLTGLLPHRGFVMHGSMACGLYPPSMAQVLIGRLNGAQIGYQATPAACYAEGLHKLGMAGAR